jgi:hypothetical protein
VRRIASRRSAIVAPGGSGQPEMTTRVGSPSVWESTMPISRGVDTVMRYGR